MHSMTNFKEYIESEFQSMAEMFLESKMNSILAKSANNTSILDSSRIITSTTQKSLHDKLQSCEEKISDFSGKHEVFLKRYDKTEANFELIPSEFQKLQDDVQQLKNQLNNLQVNSDEDLTQRLQNDCAPQR